MFEGTYTALVTPFNEDGSVDYGCLKELVEIQIEGGVEGLVPVGTTGESPTLETREHSRVIETVIEAAAKRVTIIAGTGGNSTQEALELTRHAKDAGADATLQVTPYYNKPSQEGLYRHFSAVADLGLPVVLYNVPGRSACEIAIDTIVRLAAHPHVAAVKEAGVSVDRVSHIKRRCGIDILSGDDTLTFPMMAVGAVGVISVAANVAPRLVSNQVRSMIEGQWEEAAEEHLRLHPLYCAMFLDTNPVPVKAAMAMLGRIREVYRLPLCPATDAVKGELAAVLRSVGLL